MSKRHMSTRPTKFHRVMNFNQSGGMGLDDDPVTHLNKVAGSPKRREKRKEPLLLRLVVYQYQGATSYYQRAQRERERESHGGLHHTHRHIQAWIHWSRKNGGEHCQRSRPIRRLACFSYPYLPFQSCSPSSL